MNCIKCKKDIPEDALFCLYCGKKQATEKRKRKKRANGTGTIIRKPGNRTKPWEAQKAGVFVGTYETKAEAEQALNALTNVRVTETLNLTFAQVYERWLPEHERKLTESGVKGYKSAFKRCAVLHDRVFRKLRTSDFQAVVLDMEGQGLSKSSCEKVVQLFGQLSQWAIREDICRTNYAKFVSIVATQKKNREAFTVQQIEAIQKAKSPAIDIALILLATGCRPNELFSVALKNCHADYFISGSKTEAGRNRVIPVNEIGKQSYSKLMESAKLNKGTLLIDGYSGNKEYRNFAKRDWKKLMDEAKIVGMTPYNCRHTYATMAVQSGVKPEILQKILGHADYNTTVGVYTHLDINDILSESEKVAVTDTLQTRDE